MAAPTTTTTTAAVRAHIETDWKQFRKFTEPEAVKDEVLQNFYELKYHEAIQNVDNDLMTKLKSNINIGKGFKNVTIGYVSPKNFNEEDDKRFLDKPVHQNVVSETIDDEYSTQYTLTTKDKNLLAHKFTNQSELQSYYDKYVKHFHDSVNINYFAFLNTVFGSTGYTEYLSVTQKTVATKMNNTLKLNKKISKSETTDKLLKELINYVLEMTNKISKEYTIDKHTLTKSKLDDLIIIAPLKFKTLLLNESAKIYHKDFLEELNKMVKIHYLDIPNTHLYIFDSRAYVDATRFISFTSQQVARMLEWDNFITIQNVAGIFTTLQGITVELDNTLKGLL